MTNNFRVQSFSSCHTKMREKVDFQSVQDIFKCTQVSNFIFQTIIQMSLCLKRKLQDFKFCATSIFNIFRVSIENFEKNLNLNRPNLYFSLLSFSLFPHSPLLCAGQAEAAGHAQARPRAFPNRAPRPAVGMPRRRSSPPLLTRHAVTCDTPAHGFNRIDRILISTSCNFFSGSRSRKNSKVKRAWPGAISGWVTDRELLPGCARVRTKCAKKTCVGL